MKIRSVNVSEKTGTVKTSRPFIELDASGIKGDAHSGDWHRQVSLLGEEAYRMMDLDPMEFPFGSFAENITTAGNPDERTPDLKHCKPGDRFRCGDILLEVTQIGKKCHGPGCPVQEKTGNCVMPKEGIFTRVLSGGILKADDELVYVTQRIPHCRNHPEHKGLQRHLRGSQRHGTGKNDQSFLSGQQLAPEILIGPAAR